MNVRASPPSGINLERYHGVSVPEAAWQPIDADRWPLGPSSHRERVSDPALDAFLAAYVIPTDEELLIARDTVRCVEGEL
jgi:hypothetical protein